MEPQKVFRMGGIAVGGVIVAGMLSVGFDDTPVSWLKGAVLESLGAHEPMVQVAERQLEDVQPMHLATRRPAAKQDAPEEVEEKKHRLPPGQAAEVGRPSNKGQMIQNCMKQPSCRQQLQEAKKGKRPAKVRPAATTPSPEEVEENKLGNPANIPPRGPRSELVPFSASSLLAWLNPLNPGVAEAQAFSLSVDAKRPNAYQAGLYMGTYGGYQNSTGYPRIGPSHPAHYPNYGTTENKSFVFFRVSIPTGGWYLIEVTGGKAHAKLRHQSTGPIIATWDHIDITCSSCYYTAVDYFDPGTHYFYFWSIVNNLYIYGVSAHNYP